MNYSSQKKVACIGIGGAGVAYVAKFFLHLGTEVYGFDIKETDTTKELQALGAKITFHNPTEPLEKGTTLFVYSPGLPNTILAELEKQNKKIEHLDVGKFTTEIIHAYEQGKLSTEEKAAFTKSDIAPLFGLGKSKMKYIAVTGTDGKTTTCTMIYQILKDLGFKPGLISTVSAKIGEAELDTGLHTTTPSSQELYKFLSLMEKEGCTHAIVETTSHGLAMGRLAGLKFDAVGYTNITSEHLDYHKTWENYFQAKATLITEHTKKNCVVVLNKDDHKAFERLHKLVSEQHLSEKTYSMDHDKATLSAQNITHSPLISFTAEGQAFSIPIVGLYNVSNALAAILIVSSVEKVSLSEMAKSLSHFVTVKGRMEILQLKPFTVVVDFAHTTNALEEALKTANELRSKNAKTIVVFGCAGKRDNTKRIPMGEVAGKYADIAILTAEDPRTEELKDINDLVEQGWQKTKDKTKHLIRFDDVDESASVRRNAIEMALNLAKRGDVVLIAGKAHEQSLAIGNAEYPWNDITETAKLLNEMAENV